MVRELTDKHSVTATITEREQQVFDLMCNNMAAKEIATVLQISQRTVEFHKKNLMRKFEANNVATMVRRVTQYLYDSSWD